MDALGAGGALIVHPKFAHTLPVPAPPRAVYRWDLLPHDTLRAVASFLRADDLLRFGWRPLEAPPSWRQLYRFQHELFSRVVLQRTSEVLMHMRMGSLPVLPRMFMQAMA
ncbi:hypothetical protein QJQ45_007000 [Haematococcus lacustris]|nr:hypothetical protein QJQ45_007000 [Haematococcus lacustris]